MRSISIFSRDKSLCSESNTLFNSVEFYQIWTQIFPKNLGRTILDDSVFLSQRIGSLEIYSHNLFLPYSQDRLFSRISDIEHITASG